MHLDHKESSESFDDQMKDTVLIAYKNKISQMRRIYIKFMHGELLIGTTRGLFSMRQRIRMER
jgi:hypothetical protein